MSKSLLRKIIIFLVFGIYTGIHYYYSRDYKVFVYGAIAIIITLLLDILFYVRKSTYIYSILGLIAGYFGGKLLYDVLSNIEPNIFIKEVQNYFILSFAYIGFSLPIFSGHKYGFGLGVLNPGEREQLSSEIKILDTSVIIDGRISDIAATGFLSGVLILPKFVLNEIQTLADSKDPIKRSRARRGLDVLNKLKEIQQIDLRIYSRDYPDIKGVDGKLINLAKELNGSIVTNDYNLNKVAKLDGIQILNINDLANALKPILLPGEEFELDILKEGKENNQGVGYLSDGTMVVVANGSSYIGKKIIVKVTSVLQTSAGRIIFTEPKKS